MWVWDLQADMLGQAAMRLMVSIDLPWDEGDVALDRKRRSDSRVGKFPLDCHNYSVR